ncbi:Crp/Fnr family transcriptional regulator [Spirochaetia bacterium]|nr:Crp/Fnr family transcriptional regulator [Spirochaetia bacterium]
MTYFSPVLRKCALFESIAEKDLEALLNCLSARKRKAEKGSFIFNAGDKVGAVGILLSGRLHIVADDFWGNHSIVSSIEPGELFGEVFSFSVTEKIPISVTAVMQSEIILIDYKKIITTCSSACKFHTLLIRNMLKNLAQKTFSLMQKMDFITQRTTREKILSYLSSYAQNKKSDEFEIPFNRQELADYLSVERSALSAELCRMRDDNILTFNKNKFKLINDSPFKASFGKHL